MNPTNPKPPIAEAIQLLAGIPISFALNTFIQLGIPEYLNQGQRSVAEIAKHCQTQEEISFRFLRFLSKLGLVQMEGISFKLTALGNYFRKDQPGNFCKNIEFMCSPPWFNTWSNLMYSLKTGDAAFKESMGMEPWDYFEKHPEYGIPFNEYMTQISKNGAANLLNSYNFVEAGIICDVGGGHGFLLNEILLKYQDKNGILFDLPFVIKDVNLSNISDRCAVVGGSFFDEIPVADHYILKSILHDWSNEKATTILKNCAKSLKPFGKILVIDMILGKDESILSYFYDLHMQLMMNGRERTEEEFRVLFASAGLRITKIIPTGSPQFIIEGEII
ncbi:MAG: hypothetical protein IPO78_15575 [Saprospiraceae bacterium]|nr:hypothetical protein [Saprospiraceae bacterium]